MDYKNNGLNYDRLRNTVDKFFNLVKLMSVYVCRCVGVCVCVCMRDLWIYIVVFCEK